MCADGLGGDGGGEGCVGDVEGGVVCQLEQAGFGIAGGDCAFDMNDGGDMGMPVGAGERAGGIEGGDGAGFVTIAASVAGPEDVVCRMGRSMWRYGGSPASASVDCP